MTANDHEPPTPPFLLFRTSHPPYNTHATQHAIPRGRELRCSGPKSPGRDRPGSGIRFLGFAQLTTSRSRLARTRHHRRSPASHQNSVMSQNSGAPVQRRATQPRPCARADTTRPATANYPPVCRECNTTFIPSRCAHHITTSLHITSHAPTELTGVVSQGIGKLVLRSHAAGKHVF